MLTVVPTFRGASAPYLGHKQCARMQPGVFAECRAVLCTGSVVATASELCPPTFSKQGSGSQGGGVEVIDAIV